MAIEIEFAINSYKPGDFVEVIIDEKTMYGFVITGYKIYDINSGYEISLKENDKIKVIKTKLVVFK